MKRWAFVTVLLYAVALLVLAAPVTLLAWGRWWGHNNSGIESAKVVEIFQAWPFWLWLGVMVLGQILLLVVPVDISQKKLIPRRKLLVPVVTAAFLLANVVFAGILSVACAIFGDAAFRGFEIFGSSNFAGWSVIIVILVAFWVFWGIIFYRTTKADEVPDAAARITRGLLKGSILELLVAIPSHVIVRQRETCCAPAGSFWGITTGLSVMLLCYGPGVFFLFAERFARKRPPIDAAAPRR
jgi:hypothetical protein